jgi:hypothetical protein
MTAFFGVMLLVGGMSALIKLFGLFPRALQAVRTSRSALNVMRNPELGDDHKEVLLQRYSLALLRSFLDLLMRGAGSLAIPLGLLWALEVAGVVSLKAVLALTLSWPLLLGGVFAAIAAFWLLEK